MSKNRPTIEQLKIVCRHINELEKAKMTENHAIRLLELLADMYAKTLTGGKANVHSVTQVPRDQWSLAALRARKKKPKAKAGTFLRVEHGTPRREFARKIRKLYRKRRLTPQEMSRLVKRYWKLAVLTHDEDRRLRRKGDYKSPQERWANAKIRFPKHSPNALSR